QAAGGERVARCGRRADPHARRTEGKNRPMAQVRWSLTAASDLQDIESFIARDSILHAISFVDRIVAATDKLSDSPHLGRVVPEFNRPDLRELILGSYRIVYLLKDDAVMILRESESKTYRFVQLDLSPVQGRYKRNQDRKTPTRIYIPGAEKLSSLQE